MLKQTHALILTSNVQEGVFGVASKLASLYILFNDFRSSVSVLKAMKETNSFAWNSVIKAHVHSGLSESAVFVFKLMREMGVSCDGYTFPILSKLVVLLEGGCAGFAEMIHCVAVKTGFQYDIYFCNTMIEAYLKVGCFRNALNLFDEMPSRDLVSWTSMISGYVFEGNENGAFELFSKMRKEVEPNEVTLIVMVQMCCSVFEVRQIHGYVIKSGSLVDISLKNSILKMFADFGSVGDFETLFEETATRDVVTWNTMIHLYFSKRSPKKIIDCLNKMRCEVNPSIETFTLITSGLVWCENHHSLGTQIHSLSLKSGVFDDVLLSCLLDLYANSGYFKEAILLFKQMLAANVKPEVNNMRSFIVACTHLCALRLGKAVHGYFIRNYAFAPDENNVQSLETSLLNMYVKCGDIPSARICFDKMLVKDLVAWSSMIEGYGTHGLGSEALKIFSRMISEKIKPNSITFLSLLSACSHSGLVHEGCRALNNMKSEFNIEPDLDHYTCIVDLLGRSGNIKEGLSVILRRVVLPDSKIWSALLSAARVHNDWKIGGYAARKVLELERDNPGYYTLFSNVQAGSEKWDEVQQVRSVMKEMNMNKSPGWSCLEVKGVFHGFVSGDRSHEQVEEIWAMVEFFSRNGLEEVGNGLCN
ncbi:pentatricopeptide repeat-containing protein [Striga asiatica]|uniref:Pentatricopeptide repeat-containing protein n=1 Tax=Striga asiatica TaxID=4170 RepID=A0A5A7NZA7_STRAF|nr:pentatricopeptide repeat-containing protein [Striga asiatica]